MQDGFNVRLTITARAEQVGQSLQVGDGVEIRGALLASEAAVEVGADAAMAGVAGELADVVDVLDHFLELELRGFGGGLSANPAGDHHPRIERRADDGAATEEFLELIVGELAVVRRQGAGIGVAGPDGSVEDVERFAEARVAEVRGVEDDLQPIHFRQKFASARADAAFGVGTEGVGAGAVVGGAKGAQSIGVAAFEVLESDDGIRAFEAEDVADGEFGRFG